MLIWAMGLFLDFCVGRCHIVARLVFLPLLALCRDCVTEFAAVHGAFDQPCLHAIPDRVLDLLGVLLRDQFSDLS